jgi:drug/metabolite transporter (DMT)-like permease
MLAAAWLMPAALLRSGPSFCIFRIATGFPCYLCGGTRAMHAFTHGDLAHAWSMNPLATVIGFLAAVFLPYAAVAVATGRRWRPRPARPRLALAALAVVLLAAAVANWCYLIHVGR